LQECNRIDPEGTTDLAKLNYIEPAFSALVFRHKRLRATEPVCQIHLGKARALPRLNELFPQLCVIVDFHWD
jgi:hypothetical protein